METAVGIRHGRQATTGQLISRFASFIATADHVLAVIWKLLPCNHLDMRMK